MDAIWDRQLRIQGWKQDQVRVTVALCIGLGDVGSAVVMGLCRMGVGKLVLVDNTSVSIDDLSSSVLYSQSDLNRPKVDAAVDALRSHNIATDLEVQNFNVFEEWQRLVTLARSATIIFNTIASGDYCELAIQSLALKLGIPVVQVGSLPNFQLIDSYTGQGKPCMHCSSHNLDPVTVASIEPTQIEAVLSVSHLLSSQPQAPLSVCTAGLAGMLMVAQLGNILIADPELKLVNRFVLSASTMESMKLPIEPNATCTFCSGAR